MKNCKSITFLLVVSLAALIFHFIQLQKYKKYYNQQFEETKKGVHFIESYKDAVVKGKAAEYHHIGKRFFLTDDLKMINARPGTEKGSITDQAPRLVLVFSELSCNVCQDQETKFAVDIAEKYGIEKVTAIIHAHNQRYITTYTRLNMVTFPVYHCEDMKGNFFEANDIAVTPMLLLLDDDGNIVAASYPVPGQKELSEPFHKYCKEVFENNR